MAKGNRGVVKNQLSVCVKDLARSFPRYAKMVELYLPYTEPIESVLDVARLVFETMSITPESNLEGVYRMLVHNDAIDDLGDYWHDILLICTFILAQKSLQDNVQEMYNNH